MFQLVNIRVAICSHDIPGMVYILYQVYRLIVQVGDTAAVMYSYSCNAAAESSIIGGTRRVSVKHAHAVCLYCRTTRAPRKQLFQIPD